MTVEKPSNFLPKLRFPEFENLPGWQSMRLGDILDYEQPGKYIVRHTSYQNTGTPVLTANKSFILGHTKETEGIYHNVPVIIFDDFTTDAKYVDFPFKVKSSAIKILTSRGDDELRLVYELMSRIRFDSTQHKRYFISQYQHLEIPLPGEAEQQKIADCLGSLDDLIAAESRKLEVLRQHKQGLMQQLFPQPGETVPKLRFPEFENLPGWQSMRLGDILDYEQPGKYIVRHTSYQNTGTPVLTANKSFILGHTKETEGIYHNVPVIIFDDFTTDAKYVDFPFKVKSSAIKILTSRGDDELRLVYELMSRIRFDSTQHKRYFISQYQHLEIPLPGEAEQQKIADCLGSLDDLIAAESRKLEVLRQHKQGLMQQLFPVA